MLRFSRQDKQDKGQLKEDAQKAYDDAVGAAQYCLNNELFTKYRNDYERLEKIVIEQLIEVDKSEMDPIRYGFSVKNIISKYVTIGYLLRGVKSDAGKKV